MENKQTVNYGNIFTILLTILFIGLKLTGHIGWSWWWVLSPLWLTLVFLLLVFIIMFTYLSYKSKSLKDEVEREEHKNERHT